METNPNRNEAIDLRGRTFAVRLTLIAGILIMLIKFAGYLLTHSTAILSDALESIVNVFTGMMGLFAIYFSGRPPDESHPYGHGKIEYFSAGIEGFLIILAGGIIIYESVNAFLTHPALTKLTFGLGIIAFVGLSNGLLGWYLIRSGNRSSSPALIGSGYHILSDAYTSFGVLGGLFLVHLTGIQWIDALTAGLVGLHIMFQGYGVVTESFERLMDAAEPTTLSRIVKLMVSNRKKGWIAPHRLRSWHSGPDLYIDFHLIMPYYWTLKETHDAEHQIYELLQHEFKEPVETIVHTEPCTPDCCFMCRIEDCPVRMYNKNTDHKWTVMLFTGELDAQLNLNTDPEKQVDNKVK